MLRYYITAMLTAFLALVPAPAFSEDAATIKIGFSSSLTGPLAPMGNQYEKGYRLWAEEVNSRGGLLGRKIELLVSDDAGDPERAKAIYRHLIYDVKADLLFAPYSSSVTAAVAPVTEAAGYPLLAAGAASDDLWQHGHRRLFGVFTPASRYAVGFLELALLNGISRIAIVHTNEQFTVRMAEGTLKWAERLGMKVVYYAPLTDNGHDAAVKAMRENMAEGVILCGYFDESVGMRQALDRAHWMPRAYYASVGPAMKDYQKAVGPLAEGTFTSSQWEYKGTAYPDNVNFTRKFITTYGELPTYHAASAFAAGKILETSIKRTKSLDRDRLTEALASLDTVTMLGRYGVDSTGLQVRHHNLILQWIAGEREVVWPEGLTTAKPVFR